MGKVCLKTIAAKDRSDCTCSNLLLFFLFKKNVTMYGSEEKCSGGNFTDTLEGIAVQHFRNTVPDGSVTALFCFKIV